jgi:CubicO group peptidase (beta-lactamase class C family)
MTLVALSLLAAASSAHAQQPPDVPARVAQLLDSLEQDGGFSGVVLLARAGSPVLERAFGFADREAGRRSDVETGFNIGSINKAFTGIAVRQLAAQGLIALDSTLAKHWPDYPNADVARRVTIRQLLAHRSGIGGNIFAAPPGGQRSDVKHNRDYLQLFVDEPLQFEPGTREQYSNAGFIVLGLLVERLSAVDYYEYVRRNVYQPAGMSRTGHFRSDSLPANTAIGYLPGAGAQPQRNTSTLPGRGSSAGGGYSTAHDLMRFVQALREGRIANEPPPGIGIAGGAPGLNAVVDGDLPGGFDLIVLANQSPPAAERVAERIRRVLGAG